MVHIRRGPYYQYQHLAARDVLVEEHGVPHDPKSYIKLASFRDSDIYSSRLHNAHNGKEKHGPRLLLGFGKYNLHCRICGLPTTSNWPLATILASIAACHSQPKSEVRIPPEAILSEEKPCLETSLPRLIQLASIKYREQTHDEHFFLNDCWLQV
jgi:hypothetical protein